MAAFTPVYPEHLLPPASLSREIPIYGQSDGPKGISEDPNGHGLWNDAGIPRTEIHTMRI